MLEPRRIAARQIAGRMASLLGEKVGETVGYRIRFENRTSRRTRIEVVTEGILTRMLVEDPTLEGVAVLVFDEFHERSLQTDLSLALAREAQGILRPDLKLVLMSATIDAREVCSALGAQVVSCEGKMYPVDVRYAGDTPVEDIVEATVKTNRAAHKEHEGDILAFLPVEGEIRRWSCRSRPGASRIQNACNGSRLRPPPRSRQRRPCWWSSAPSARTVALRHTAGRWPNFPVTPVLRSCC